MKKLVQKYIYYSIFFIISGVIHYYFCFYYPLRLDITPNTIKIAPEETCLLTAVLSGGEIAKPEHVAVEWTADGGEITPEGKYTAGKTLGSFTINAKLLELGLTATAEIEITKPAKKIVAVSPEVIKAAAQAKEKLEQLKEEEKKLEEEKKKAEEKKKEEEKKAEEQKKEEEKKKEEKAEEKKKEEEKKTEEQKKEEQETPAPKAEKTEEEERVQKQEERKPDLEEAKKKEKTTYKENLEESTEIEKDLRRQLEAKDQEIQKLKENQEQQLKKLQQEKQEQQKLNAQLAQQLQQVAQQLQQLKEERKQEKQESQNQIEQVKKELKEEQQKMLAQKEQEYQKEIQKTREEQKRRENQIKQVVTKKINELQEQNRIDLEKAKQEQEKAIEANKQEYQKHLLEKDSQMSKLSVALEDMKKQKQQQAQESRRNQEELEMKMQQMQKQMQNNATQQKQLEQTILALQQQRMQQGSVSTGNATGNERALINQQWQYLEQVNAGTLQHHRELVQKFSSNSNKGAVVPALDFLDSDFKNNLKEIMQFHKMQFIAYPASSDYFITVDLNKSKYSGRYQKRTDFDYIQRNFSNRSIAAEFGFPDIIREIKSDSNLYKSSNGRLNLALIFPPETADYVAWKSTTVCKKHGFDPKNVSICTAYFRQNKSGFWSMLIKELTLKNGQRVPVKDFEENW